MHELAIASSLADLVRDHVPPDGLVSRVTVRIGPLQAIEPEALRIGWQAATLKTELEQARLEFELVPWTIICRECGRSWNSDTCTASCSCGSTSTRPGGTDDLILTSLEVEMPGEDES